MNNSVPPECSHWRRSALRGRALPCSSWGREASPSLSSICSSSRGRAARASRALRMSQLHFKEIHKAVSSVKIETWDDVERRCITREMDKERTKRWEKARDSDREKEGGKGRRQPTREISDGIGQGKGGRNPTATTTRAIPAEKQLGKLLFHAFHISYIHTIHGRRRNQSLLLLVFLLLSSPSIERKWALHHGPVSGEKRCTFLVVVFSRRGGGSEAVLSLATR